MGLIKSYGNYVIQKKHQLINSGTIFERDYSTVGGVGESFDDKSLVYRQGNFLYEVNKEIVSTKLYNNTDWLKNNDNYFWCLDNIELTEDIDNSLDIILKQDSYKLKDFAYYGSCSELIRNSINDIINRFPGELYVCNKVLEILDENDDFIPLKYENEELIVIDNPLQIDIHTQIYSLGVKEQEELKYISSNINNYELIDSNNNVYSIIIENYEEINGKCVSDFFAIVTLSYSNSSLKKDVMKIYCYRDENNNVIYLTNQGKDGLKIRPKQKFYNDFIKSLDIFQKVLLNSNSKPKYSAIFEVMEENEYGYRTFYKKFIFPTSEGDYNLDIVGEDFQDYVNSLSKYALLYDEIYCNNLFNHMTHESIKNFDWTDVLNRNNETKEDYIENGQKIEKLLQICGREFDEIKFYIDGIKNTNIITYNDANNIPDYFLTDTLNIEGWDVKNVSPFKIVNETFNEDNTLIIKPYSNLQYEDCENVINTPNGYFCGYWDENNCTQSKVVAQNNEYYKNDTKGILREKIQQYINDKSYTMQDVNNKFMKYLKLNSRAISQKKGTMESIESVLSLFGLKSKRWFDSLEKNLQHRLINEMNLGYDYDITEYVAITTPLEDISSYDNENGLPKQEHLYEFFNSTKNLVYNTKNYKDGVYEPYIGLPIRYYEIDNKRYLYPYFSYNQPIDGKPYYQMNGGWLHKKYCLSGITFTNLDSGFIDTQTQIPIVNDVKELLKIKEDALYDGIIYYVKNIQGEYICINDEIYDIQEDLINRYFEIMVYNGGITLGTQQFYDVIETYDSDFQIITIDLNKYKNGSALKIFIHDNNTILLKQDEQIIINYAIFKDGTMISSYDAENINNDLKTHYFILNDKQWRKVLGFWGWNQLLTTDSQYITVSKLQRQFSGNNPHTNGLKYDDGKEYLKYFQHLFKYAIEKETFDQNCYSTINEYVNSLYEMENNIGFPNLFIENECNEEIKLYIDKKIHYFCDYRTSKQDNSIFYFYEFNENSVSNSYNFYENQDYLSLKEDNVLSGAVSNNQTCLDQIVNLKNIKLTLFSRTNNYDKFEVKYFDEVILHYLSQILPSNIILTIEFAKKDEYKNKNYVIDNILHTSNIIDNNNLIINDGYISDTTLVIK